LQALGQLGSMASINKKQGGLLLQDVLVRMKQPRAEQSSSSRSSSIHTHAIPSSTLFAPAATKDLLPNSKSTLSDSPCMYVHVRVDATSLQELIKVHILTAFRINCNVITGCSF
jgi:hypothetical protein